jgi:Ca-activated chloride channel family protein
MKKLLLLSAGAVMIITGIIVASNFNQTEPIAFTGTGSISGTILDEDFQTPIPNASVLLYKNTEFFTDALGHFEIKNLEAGTYSITVTALGYATKSEKVLLAEGEQKIIDFTLMITDIKNKPGDLKEENVELNFRKEKSVSKQYDMADELSYGYASPTTSGTYMSNDMPDGEYGGNFNTESYNTINENIFKDVIGNPLSTFSIDVDNASYSNIRRFINYGQAPPKDAVRIEEMINYFDYAYTQPKNNDPFSINYEMSECPWNTETKLIMVGLQGKEIDYTKAAPSNLVFLIDVSGSMDGDNRLPLVKKSLIYLIDNLKETDRIALVVYAGAAGIVLPSTPVSQKQTIKDAINHLEAGGSTAGGAGIELAYKTAVENLISEGNNRVILCTDGDFNIGSSSDGEMTRLIEEKRKTGVYLTICGFGMGNYKDSKMETIANNGNGNYYYIDDEKESQKVFGTDMRGTLFTIAKDVKIQIEFNPAQVESYRLIGYENRLLNKEDFNNDLKDAGELGAGHRVTALYEVKLRKVSYEPKGMKDKQTEEELKYQTTQVNEKAYYTDEILTLKLRYKAPNSDVSKLIEKPLANSMIPISSTSDNFRFASAVIEFGMLLRDSEFKGDATYEEVVKLANSARGADKYGYRDEFISLVKTYTGFAQK